MLWPVTSWRRPRSVPSPLASSPMRPTRSPASPPPPPPPASASRTARSPGSPSRGPLRGTSSTSTRARRSPTEPARASPPRCRVPTTRRPTRSSSPGPVRSSADRSTGSPGTGTSRGRSLRPSERCGRGPPSSRPEGGRVGPGGQVTASREGARSSAPAWCRRSSCSGDGSVPPRSAPIWSSMGRRWRQVGRGGDGRTALGA